MSWKPYTKTIVAVATAVLVTLSALLGEGGDAGSLTLADWITVLLAGLGAAGVYVLPNEPDPVNTLGASGPEPEPQEEYDDEHYGSAHDSELGPDDF